MKEEIPNLNDLSVEELENLRSEIITLIEKKVVPKKYNIGDCFIRFNRYPDLTVVKITSSYKHHYKCTYIYNNGWNYFNREKRNLNDKDLDSYTKIETSLYDSIESFTQKYNQLRTVDYNQLHEKYHKGITEYIENLKIKFQND